MSRPVAEWGTCAECKATPVQLKRDGRCSGCHDRAAKEKAARALCHWQAPRSK